MSSIPPLMQSAINKCQNTAAKCAKNTARRAAIAILPRVQIYCENAIATRKDTAPAVEGGPTERLGFAIKSIFQGPQATFFEGYTRGCEEGRRVHFSDGYTHGYKDGRLIGIMQTTGSFATIYFMNCFYHYFTK